MIRQATNDKKLMDLNIRSVILFIIILSYRGWCQTILINEFMSSNVLTIPDEDNDYEDWIELYNPSEQMISLENFGLSDDEDEPLKWQFPGVYVAPHSHMVIFASGKDRHSFSVYDAPYWDTVVLWGHNWHYYDQNTDPPDGWREIDFDDSSWQIGPSGFGYGDDDDATIVDQTIALQIRTVFNITSTENISHLLFHIDYDDAFVAYLNGNEIARSNIGTPGIVPEYDQTADTYLEAQIYQGGLPQFFPIDDPASLLVEGQNVLAVQGHNYALSSSDLTLIPFLTIGMMEHTDEPSSIDSMVAESFGNLHTNFKISAEGEPVILYDTSAVTIDSIGPVSLLADISFGRDMDGTDPWVYYSEPTPGSTNNETDGSMEFSDSVHFSHTAGYYSGSISVSLTVEDPVPTIYFSLNGGDPTMDSSVYVSPIIIDSTTVIRARSYAPGHLPGRTITNTYLIDENVTMPVLSISTSPSNLWDWETGIYVSGPNASPDYPHFGANYWQDWEKPAHLEFFEESGQKVIGQDIGIKIQGGYSRVWPQKCFSLFARGDYGKNSFEHQLFPDLEIEEFSAFILRNSGSEWSMTMIRDAMMQALISEHTSLDIMSWRPAIVFLNGVYWGMLNIREKQNEDYLSDHHGVDPDEVDILEGNASIIEGENVHYNDLLDYIDTHSLSDPEHYDHVRTQMDIDNYIDYQIAEIYFANTDWPGNNIKYWRQRTDTGKWRWMVFDTDFGFGYFSNAQVNSNTLAMATDPSGPGWPNPPWSTWLIRELLLSEEFKIDFIRRFADHLNIPFHPDRVSDMILSMHDILDPEMPRTIDRWKDEPADFDRSYGSYEDWLSTYEVLFEFAQDRPYYVRQHIEQKFDLNGHTQLNIMVVPTGSGKVKVNRIVIPDDEWEGHYFYDIPIKLTAIPEPGYRFTQWSGESESAETSIDLIFLGDDPPLSSHNISANFEVAQADTTRIVINEINYRSSDDFDPGDWVEIYNHNDVSIGLSGWQFMDSEEHIFIIPNGLTLGPFGHLVLCRDIGSFSDHFPYVENVIGPLGFGLSGSGEYIGLANSNGSLVDSLTYGNGDPWPIDPNGGGHTLELIDPEMDNGLWESWRSSLLLYGSPGRANDTTGLALKNNISLPKTFVLYPNFPNPFNPRTYIRYEIPRPMNVQLVVYDLLGRTVNELVDSKKDAGIHFVSWDGTNYIGEPVSAGIYFYRISAGSFSSSHSMIFLK